MSQTQLNVIRGAIASITADVSHDAVGSHTPKLHDIFAPEGHATALDPASTIVVGPRGTGKSFWAGVLGQRETRAAAATAYPNLGLEKTIVEFGFTGLSDGFQGTTRDHIDENVPNDASVAEARTFWWATILRAMARSQNQQAPGLKAFMGPAGNTEEREKLLIEFESYSRSTSTTLIIVFDALDTLASTWPRRRMLTTALLEVVWLMRAYRSIKMKLFLRPDQIDDDELQFVELPKLRAAAVRLVWSGLDLYGLLYTRLVLFKDDAVRDAFTKQIRKLRIELPSHERILSREWSLLRDPAEQTAVMSIFAGPYMASGINGFKKGKTYDWPLKHLADAFDEVTPRSFLGLMIAASKHGPAPDGLVITPEGIRHGLRAASRMRVDQLHGEFPWIKGVLAPLDGLLLPAKEAAVFKVWMRAKTIQLALRDAEQRNYLPPFASRRSDSSEHELYEALKHIGVMFRRKDSRLDMPDLFRVAAKLLKKGATAPL